MLFLLITWWGCWGWGLVDLHSTPACHRNTDRPGKPSVQGTQVLVGGHDMKCGKHTHTGTTPAAVYTTEDVSPLCSALLCEMGTKSLFPLYNQVSLTWVFSSRSDQEKLGYQSLVGAWHGSPVSTNAHGVF